MKNPKMTEKEWLKDFQEFMESDGAPVPQDISQKISRRIYKALNPSAWFVFVKLLAIHSVVGTLSLAVCDQFGMNPFNSGISLAHFFMKFGHSACMVLCGFLFVGLSVSLASLLMNFDEWKVLRKNLPVQIFALSMLSLGMFLAFGAEIVFGIALLWLAGAMVGGVVPTFILKRRFS